MTIDNKKQTLNLQLNSDNLNHFCKKIIARSRNTAHVHEALTVLEAFISTFSTDSLGSDQYKEIQQALKVHSAKTRDILMQEKTKQLQHALLTKNITSLSTVYRSLSRNGFYQILATASKKIEIEKIQPIVQWVVNWSEQARQKAEQASGYPDALDFKKAHINIEEYQTMSDISHFFKTSEVYNYA